MVASPNPRVLVIDDDPDIRTLLATCLQNEGFAVDEAADGIGALGRIASADYDLLITDMRLPGRLNGVETVRCARAVHPGLLSLFISGCEELRYENPDLDNFVSKPFKPHELLGCIWELLCRKQFCAR